MKKTIACILSLALSVTPRLFADGAAPAEVAPADGQKPLKVLMIGNSLKSDIAPALTIGAWAIHIPFHVTWQLEHFEDIKHERLQKIEHFSEIIKLLK